MDNSEQYNEINSTTSSWRRLTVDRFDSMDGFEMDQLIYDVDEDGVQRGRYDKRIDFLMLVTGYIVGLSNAWMFPFHAYKYGGITYLIPYTLFSFLMGLPMVILEMGLGQFTSEGSPKVFKCVPILFGIGWTQVVISFIYMIYYTVIVAYSFLYLLASLSQPLPWSSCNNSFNSHRCLSSLSMNDLDTNETMIPSSFEFFYRYVLGVQRNDGTYYRINEFPGVPQWHLSMCLFIVWIVSFLSILHGVRISGKVAYFTAIYPYLGFFVLFILGCTLPGAAQGLKSYLIPNITKLRDPQMHVQAFGQCFLSLGLGLGALISLSSHNNFHDNFYRDAVFLVVVDCISSFISGLALFPFIGYMKQRNNGDLTGYIGNGFDLLFILIVEALSTLNGSNMWTILFMIMIITLAMDTQFVILETLVTAIGDRYIEIHKKLLYRVLGIFTISLLAYLFGLLLITPGGIYYLEILHHVVKIYTLPFIAIMECITIGIVYGHKNFRRDITMMTGFQLNNYYFISITYICPIVLFIMGLIAVILQNKSKHELPIWCKLLYFLSIMITMGPLFIGAIHIIKRYRSRYQDKTFEQYLNYLIKPPIYYGPQYKVNWLLDKEYKVNLIKYRKDPRFLSHINQYENIRQIYRKIKKGEQKETKKRAFIKIIKRTNQAPPTI